MCCRRESSKYESEVKEERERGGAVVGSRRAQEPPGETGAFSLCARTGAAAARTLAAARSGAQGPAQQARRRARKSGAARPRRTDLSKRTGLAFRLGSCSRPSRRPVARWCTAWTMSYRYTAPRSRSGTEPTAPTTRSRARSRPPPAPPCPRPHHPSWAGSVPTAP